ncbi:hypothetical protein ACTFIW_003067 [Dictyostelium discoideum]
MTKKIEKIDDGNNVSKTIITKAQVDQKMRNDEAEKLFWIFNNKFRPIDYKDVVENVSPRKTTLNREKVENDNIGQIYNELFFFKLVFNDKISTFLKTLINKNLKKKREKKINKGKDASRLNDLTDITFWKFITDYLKNTYSNKNTEKIPPQLIKLKMMDHNRYSAIHSVLDMKGHRFDEYCELFMDGALKYINIGNVLNCDETIYAYYGKDAIKDNELINNDSKPHSVGIEAYSLITKMQISNCPYVISYGPRTPENCLSPFNSLKRLLEKFHTKYNWEDQKNKLIICCDFALVNKGNLDQLNCRILSSTRKSGTTVAQEIKKFVKPFLTTQKTFLFYEYTKNVAGHINCTATNMYSRYSNPFVEINNNLNIEQFATIGNLFRFSKKELELIFDGESFNGAPLEILNSKYNTNLVKPPCGPSWNENVLKKLSTEHITQIYNFKYKKEDNNINKNNKINKILEPLDKTQESLLFDKNKNYSKKEIQDLKIKIIGDHQNRSKMIHDQYIFSYNLVDITDKRYYATIRGSSSHSYTKLFILGGLFDLILNAYSLHREYHELELGCENPESEPPEIIQTINKFVESLIFQLHELKELQ